MKAVLAPYLLGATATGHKGANILLYGPAGVGKTECIRVLAREANISLYEVAYADEAGAPIGGQARLRAYRAAQRFLAAQPAVLVFDEVEDVFGPRPLFMDDGVRMGGSPISKAWVNHVLETNEVPTVWVTNTIVASMWCCSSPAPRPRGGVNCWKRSLAGCRRPKRTALSPMRRR